jgi:hypothetical protein
MQPHYGHARSTWAGCHRSEIPSRHRGEWVAPSPFIGALRIILPGFDLDWSLRQDMRDVRRFYALDLDGNRHAHAAPRELMHELARVVPRYSGARD